MSDLNPVRQDDPQATSVSDPAPQRMPGLPRIGLMGEFSAGKTTLINFLLGAEILPTRVTATQMPPVWISHGPRAAHAVDMDGNRRDLSFEELATVAVEGVRYVRITCESDLLREFELIDTPGISDPNIPDMYRQAVVEFVDAVIWCTHAPQAWRESERSAWMAMPEKLFGTSVLLATRADKLEPKDRRRVEARLRHEIGHGFRDIIMFSTLDAIRSVSMEDGAALFEASGADRLARTLRQVADTINGAPPAGDAPAQATSGVVVPLQQAGVRPARVARVPSSGRARRRDEDRRDDEAAEAPAFAPTPLRAVPTPVAADEDAVDATEPTQDEVAPAAPPAVLNLSAYLVTPDDDDSAPTEVASDAFQVAPEDFSAVLASIGRSSAVTEATPAEATPAEAAPADEMAAEGMAPEPVAEAPQPAELDEDVVTGLAAAPGPVTARAIWDEVLAEGDIRSISQMLAAIGQFVDRLDRRGMFLRPEAAVDMRYDDDQM